MCKLCFPAHRVSVHLVFIDQNVGRVRRILYCEKLITRLPTMKIARRLDPTRRSDQKRSDPPRVLSESDIFYKKPIGSDRLSSDSFQSESDSDFVGIQRSPIKSDRIRPDYRRIPMNPD